MKQPHKTSQSTGRLPAVQKTGTVAAGGLGFAPILSRIPFLVAVLLLVVCTTPRATAGTSTNAARLLVIVGAAGEASFSSNFVQQAGLWREVAAKGGVSMTTLGLDEPAVPATQETDTPRVDDLQRLHSLIQAEPTDTPQELWIVLIGHGTFDGKEALFNLRGPDLSGSELAAWLKPFRRPIAVIDTASASAPFINKLAATNRVIISATRSGHEHNATRFGRCLAEAIADPRGDLDQDGQTSLLEAFLSASFQVAEFYKTEGRMATEHALIDDNGDGFGTPADWFRGLRPVKKSKDTRVLDGLRAHQFHLVRSPDEARLSPEVRARRDALEADISKLRESRVAMGDEAYFARLEPLLLDLARIYKD